MSLNKRLHDIFKSTSRLLVARDTKKCTDHVYVHISYGTIN